MYRGNGYIRAYNIKLDTVIFTKNLYEKKIHKHCRSHHKVLLYIHIIIFLRIE